jgi:N-acetylmuramoyl-L-alanine amidase
VGDRLPYASTQEMDPTRLQIDLFGATANSNWIIQKPTTKEIKSVDYRQTGAGVVRITIALNHRQVWGYSISYSGALLVIRIRRQPEVLKLKSLTFAIDAGHGGSNDGALGCTGAKEKDVTLAVARHLKEQLEDRGAKVVMIRDKDTTIATSDRLKKVLGMDAAMLISVHVNSIGLTSNPEDTKGVGLYYKYPCYRPLSDFLLRDLEKTGLTPFGTVGSFNFALNAPTELPNALVELGYISNPEDEMKLIDDDFRADAAKRIVEGIKDFLDSCANGE